MRIIVYHSHIKLEGYNLGDYPDFEKLLSVWVDTEYRYNPIGYEYDEETKTLIIPRGCNINILASKFNATPEIIYTSDDYAEISMRVNVPPRNDIQKQAIAFLIGESDYAFTKKYSQLLLNLETGGGKTYITSAAMQFYRMRTMIIVHQNKIKSQWIDTFLTKTDLTESDIVNISGSSKIDYLFKHYPHGKVYIVTHSALASYAKHNGWESIHELFKFLKIGLKVIDEAHLMFANMAKIDFHTNCKKNIYLTATVDRSDPYEQRLFKLYTRNIVKFDKQVVRVTRKHIMYLAIMYNSSPSLDVKAAMYTMRKFNKSKYSQYQSTCDKFFDVIKFTIEYFIRKKGKMLILTSTIDTCETLRDFIHNLYPSKVVTVYHSKISKEDRLKAFDADIICSTPQSAGTGTDIPGLRVLINCEAYSSKVTADQIPGRLREFNETDNTYYVELVDTGFKAVYGMYERRLPTIKRKCLKALTLDYDNPKPSTF